MTEYFISLAVSIILGFALGLERELTNKQAGLRTHIFVCLGSCVFTLLSIHAFPTFAIGDNVDITQATGLRDTARVAAQIVTGIGFIGAGTVMKNGSSVHGLTTAATLWLAASIGMACGAGNYSIAICATVLSILVLICVKWIEKYFLRQRKVQNKKLRLSIRCQNCDVNSIQDFIIEKYPFVSEIKKVESETDNEAKIVTVISVRHNNPLQSLYKDFEQVSNIKSISIREANE